MVALGVVALGAFLAGPWFGIPLACLVLIGFDFAASAWRERGKDR